MKGNRMSNDPAARIIVASCSLNPSSRSRIMAQQAMTSLERAGNPAKFMDLRDFDLPLCDGNAAWRSPEVGRVRQLLTDADAVILAVPIYNYDVNAAAKNLVELTGKDAWRDKVVAFLCAAGGSNSYMSVMSFANSLMLDFRCLIVPRFVYANSNAFSDSGIVSDEVLTRIDELCETTAALSSAACRTLNGH